ncbi:MAG: phosphatase PAP2 family protein [Candidatus Anstonellales archaeon]
MSDIISTFSSLIFSFVYAIAMILNNNFIFIPLIILIAYLLDKWKGAFFIFFSGIVTFIVKQIFALPRVCNTPIPCFDDFAFPSGHATLAFSLALLRIDKEDFWLYMFFAFFVSFTRLILGVHTIQEVIAGLALALINIEIWWLYWKK